MGTKLAVFDMNKVLTEETLAFRLAEYRPGAVKYFRAWKNGIISDRGIVVYGSGVYQGLSKELIQKEAEIIQPRINDLDLPGWKTAIISMDYYDLVELTGKRLKVDHCYGNRIRYENEVHSGTVEEPVIDLTQKKEIVKSLKREFNPNFVVGVDNIEKSPFIEVCDKFLLVRTREELLNALMVIRTF
jgi:phosphoserine phosphatase